MKMGYLKLVQREDERQAAMAGLMTKQLTQPGGNMANSLVEADLVYICLSLAMFINAQKKVQKLCGMWSIHVHAQNCRIASTFSKRLLGISRGFLCKDALRNNPQVWRSTWRTLASMPRVPVTRRSTSCRVA